MSKKNKAPAKAGKTEAHRAVAGNKRARYEFELLEHWEAGISLLGSEVKSCRAAAVNLSEAFVRLRRGEAWLVGCRIAPYEQAGRDQHDPLRERKLLLHAEELHKIQKGIELRGLTLVPTGMYFAGSKVKVAISLARGKKLHDKRATEKQREQDRSARQATDI